MKLDPVLCSKMSGLAPAELVGIGGGVRRLALLLSGFSRLLEEAAESTEAVGEEIVFCWSSVKTKSSSSPPSRPSEDVPHPLLDRAAPPPEILCTLVKVDSAFSMAAFCCTSTNRDECVSGLRAL